MTLAVQEPDIDALRELVQDAGVFEPAARSGAWREAAGGDAIIRRSNRNRRWTNWLADVPADAPVAVATGEMMSETVIGVCGETGRGSVDWRSIRDRVPSGRPLAHDIKALIRRFGDSSGAEA